MSKTYNSKKGVFSDWNHRQDESCQNVLFLCLHIALDGECFDTTDAIEKAYTINSSA